MQTAAYRSLEAFIFGGGEGCHQHHECIDLSKFHSHLFGLSRDVFDRFATVNPDYLIFIGVF